MRPCQCGAPRARMRRCHRSSAPLPVPGARDLDDPLDNARSHRDRTGRKTIPSRLPHHLRGLEAASTRSGSSWITPSWTPSPGEGERTVTALLAALAGERDWREIDGLAWRSGASVLYSRSPASSTPRRVALPRRDDIAAVLDAGGPVSMSSSRGCPGRCSFCSVRAFYGLSEGRPWREDRPGRSWRRCRKFSNAAGRAFSPSSTKRS